MYRRLLLFRREHLIEIRKRRAGFGSAGYYVNRLADNRDTEAVAGIEHRGPAAPPVVHRIEGFDPILCPALCFTAKDKDFTAQ